MTESAAFTKCCVCFVIPVVIIVSLAIDKHKHFYVRGQILRTDFLIVT